MTRGASPYVNLFAGWYWFDRNCMSWKLDAVRPRYVGLAVESRGRQGNRRGVACLARPLLDRGCFVAALLAMTWDGDGPCHPTAQSMLSRGRRRNGLLPCRYGRIRHGSRQTLGGTLQIRDAPLRASRSHGARSRDASRGENHDRRATTRRSTRHSKDRGRHRHRDRGRHPDKSRHTRQGRRNMWRPRQARRDRQHSRSPRAMPPPLPIGRLDENCAVS
jgi:hypothetical protein